jgi:hypothetical protein
LEAKIKEAAEHVIVRGKLIPITTTTTHPINKEE